MIAGMFRAPPMSSTPDMDARVSSLHPSMDGCIPSCQCPRYCDTIERTDHLAPVLTGQRVGVRLHIAPILLRSHPIFACMNFPTMGKSTDTSKSSRTSVACLRCRTRKIRCTHYDGPKDTSCKPCRDRGHPCSLHLGSSSQISSRDLADTVGEVRKDHRSREKAPSQRSSEDRPLTQLLRIPGKLLEELVSS